MYNSLIYWFAMHFVIDGASQKYVLNKASAVPAVVQEEILFYFFTLKPVWNAAFKSVQGFLYSMCMCNRF